MHATENNHIELVNYLIDIGADYFQKDFEGNNILAYAKKTYDESKNSSLFGLYINLSVNPYDKNNVGSSIYDKIIEENNQNLIRIIKGES